LGWGRRLGRRRVGWRWLGRVRMLLSGLGSAASAAVLLLRRLEQRRLEQRPLEQRRLEQRRLGWRRLGWRWLGWWGWLVICGPKKSGCHRNQFSSIVGNALSAPGHGSLPEEFAYPTKQMGAARSGPKFGDFNAHR